MGQGNYERQRLYFHNPNIQKSIEDIYSDLDNWTCEIFENEPHRFETVSFFVVLPPLYYEGTFIKGLYLSESVDLLNKALPQLSEVFFSFAYSMWCSYPWSVTADAYSCLYDNPHREDWFRKTYPERKNKILIPCYDSDFLNEYLIAPKPISRKDIDVLCVSRLSPEKNLPIVAQALKIYRQKYPERQIMMTLILGHAFDVHHPETGNPGSLEEWRKIEAILGNPLDYIRVIPFADYYSEMPIYYSRSKVCVLGSLLEGKNRFLSEAMSCNVPVICFKEFNQYVRGEDQVFPETAGLYAQFDPESLADTLHQVLQNPQDFKPRWQYLQYRGRKNFFNTCLDYFPYYKTSVPDYRLGQAFNNIWLDLAVQQNYQISLSDFLYGRSNRSHIRGLTTIYKTVNDWIRMK